VIPPCASLAAMALAPANQSGLFFVMGKLAPPPLAPLSAIFRGVIAAASLKRR
jgi:hypothetical protein